MSNETSPEVGQTRDGAGTTSETGPADLASLPPGVLAQVKRMVQAEYAKDLRAQLGTAPRPINWRSLPPEDLEQELLALNEWVDWLRHAYGLPPQIIPPMWHRHWELIWELSALRQHWLTCYDQQAKGNLGVVWHNDFAAARERLRDWVSICGSRLDRDRPTRVTAWPGGEAEDWVAPSTEEQSVTERSQDFVDFVFETVRAREREQDALMEDILEGEEDHHDGP